jgi:dTDP-4-dehydrorhamnose 3,5-epimerase
LLYLHTEFHAPKDEGGFRYDSPALGIQWPLAVADLSERDRTLNFFHPSFEGLDL